MTKAELVAAVADKTQSPKTQAEQYVTAVFEAVSDAIAKGEDVTLVGFGTMKVAERAAREGRNPRTGESLMIPATKTVRFSPGKAIKEKLNPPKPAKPAEPEKKAGKAKKK